MAEIPTMACPECMGSGRVDDLPDAYYPCPECRESGRIPRPPMTPDEIAALPDGARVVVYCWDKGDVYAATVRIRWDYLYSESRKLPHVRRRWERWCLLWNAGVVWLTGDGE